MQVTTAEKHLDNVVPVIEKMDLEENLNHSQKVDQACQVSIIFCDNIAEP